VPNLIAKPIIDLMLGVNDYPAAFLRPALLALGYESLGEAGIAGREYFRCRSGINCNLHVVLTDGSHWRNNLALRKYLRNNEGARYCAMV